MGLHKLAASSCTQSVFRFQMRSATVAQLAADKDSEICIHHTHVIAGEHTVTLSLTFPGMQMLPSLLGIKSHLKRAC